jgi:glutamyl-tRNA reductase
VSVATAPLPLREALSYGADAAVDLMQSASIDGLEEVLVVSTCNRTEFYLAVEDGSGAETGWLEHVRRTRPAALIGEAGCRLFRARDACAARHLFRVACGLDSAILGDAHIGRQLKQALAWAARAGSLGPLLDQTFQQAFAAIKEAQTGTGIGRGHASLGSAVAGLIRERRGAGVRVLLVGAGTAAGGVARPLAQW